MSFICRPCHVSKHDENEFCDQCSKYTNVGIMNDLYICHKCINDIIYDKFEYCGSCHNITYCTENPEIQILKNKIAEIELLKKKLELELLNKLEL